MEAKIYSTEECKAGVGEVKGNNFKKTEKTGKEYIQVLPGSCQVGDKVIRFVASGEVKRGQKPTQFEKVEMGYAVIGIGEEYKVAGQVYVNAYIEKV